MINGLEGIPRSGKSYEATVYHVLHALASGRMVITNLPLFRDKFMAMDPAYGALIVMKRRPSPVLGTWSANRFDDDGKGNAYELFPDGHTEPVDPTLPVFGHVWDFYTTWKHPETGQGPLFVIDECHVPFPKIGTPKEVVECFKLHGHFNVDVLLMTQNFREMCAGIASNLEMLIRVRKASFLGKPDVYVRKVHAGFRGPLISTEERPYKKQYFGLYKSHTQGNSVAESTASDVKPFLVTFKRWSWVVMALGVVIVVATIANKASTKPASTTKTVLTTSDGQVVQTLAPGSLQAPTPLPGASAPGQTKTAEIPEPYESKGFHLTGRASMGDKVLYMFAVSQNGLPVSNVTHKELERAGYRWVALTDCAGTLFWQDKAIPVTCDVPQVSLAAAGPVSGAGKAVSQATN